MAKTKKKECAHMDRLTFWKFEGKTVIHCHTCTHARLTPEEVLVAIMDNARIFKPSELRARDRKIRQRVVEKLGR